MTTPPSPAPHSALSTSTGARVVVLVAHPQMEVSRLNRALMMAAARRDASDATGGPPPEVDVRDLYALYPDYVIDVDAERRALLQARLIVWLHPIRWYGPPPLLKLWFDEVLGFGWAYGPNGTALRGKSLWVVITTGGTEASYRRDGYNRYPFEAFLPPYEVTATLCGMQFLPPLVIHGAHRLRADEVDAHASDFAARLRAFPAWPGLAAAAQPAGLEVPTDARPQDGDDHGDRRANAAADPDAPLAPSG